MHPARQLRQRLADHSRGPLLLPGAFNALTARAIERAGFEALYLSGAALSNCVYGRPDVGLTTLTEAAAQAAAVCQAVRCPVISDADTGFGDAPAVARTVQAFSVAGVAGIHIEDQVLPKKCGHLEGKELISTDAMCEKIRVATATAHQSDLFIIARTDARGVTGFDDAIERAGRYVEAGAEAIFPEALSSRDEFEQFARRIKVPLLANMTEFGKSPLLSVTELHALGYRMIIYPMTLVRVSMKAIDQLLADLKRDGSQTAWLDRMQTRAELYDLLDYDGLGEKK